MRTQQIEQTQTGLTEQLISVFKQPGKRDSKIDRAYELIEIATSATVSASEFIADAAILIRTAEQAAQQPHVSYGDTAATAAAVIHTRQQTIDMMDVRQQTEQITSDLIPAHWTA